MSYDFRTTRVSESRSDHLTFLAIGPNLVRRPTARGGKASVISG